MSSNIRVPKICQFCGSDFIAKTTVTKYCGDTCAKKAYKQRKREQKITEIAPLVAQKKGFNQHILKEKDFLSISETCTLLGASRMTIYRQIKKGNIMTMKLGRRIIIKRSEIEKLFNS